MTQPVLKIDGLRTYFRADDGLVKAVDDISLQIKKGTTLGVVGESGSGKSVTALSIMRLLAASAEIVSGQIAFLGQDLVATSENNMRRIRGGDISMIFQEPMTSLNPVFTVGQQVMEAILLHQKTSKRVAREKTIELFREVGIPEPETRINSYPHQLSGGQKQRVMIAMSLSCNPQLLIADEPTTALDVTIQAQILEILCQLRDARGMAILFITHDLGVIAEIADQVAVMYRGKIVEYGEVLDIYENPSHPYTKGLLACRPRLESKYRFLPTVDDFMETKEQENGQFEIVEKQVDESRLEHFRSAGRGRRLHPLADLEALGYPWDPSTHDDDTEVVDKGTDPILEVKDLKVHFPIHAGVLRRVAGHVKAVDGVSFKIFPGQTLGLVGESGCGKTTAGRAILRLLNPTSGQIVYRGQDITHYSPAEMRPLRRQMQIIFQDPYGSLNPRMTIASAITEPMRVQGIGSSRSDRRDRAVQLLEEVDLSSDYLRRYPHEFSGGQRQRICIARALAAQPEFVVCDESVSALDVSVQAQVLNLLKDLQEKRGLTYIFISHDLSVVKFMSDMMAVMNAGKFVEFGPAELIYEDPQEEYTRRLIEATPRDDLDSLRARVARRRESLSAG
jgi:peptide/nickel transport system ATP-binding protein